MKYSVSENVNTKRIKSLVKMMNHNFTDKELFQQSISNRLSADMIYNFIKYMSENTETLDFFEASRFMGAFLIFMKDRPKVIKNITKEEIQAVLNIIAVGEVMGG